MKTSVNKLKIVHCASVVIGLLVPVSVKIGADLKTVLCANIVN